MAHGAWMVPWTERERGWGMRPDGYWYYPSEQAAQDKTAEKLKKIRADEARRYAGGTPDEYSFPEDARFVPVSAEFAAEITEKGEVYRQHREDSK